MIIIIIEKPTSCSFDIKITEIREITARPVLWDSYAFVVLPVQG